MNIVSKEEKANLFNIYDFALLALVVLMCVVGVFIFLTGRVRKANTQLSISTISNNINKKLDFASFLIEDSKETGHKEFKQYISRVDLDDEDISYFYTKEAMDVREMAIIKCLDSDRLSNLEKDIKNRIEEEKSKFISYGVGQYDLLNKSKLIKIEPYIFFAVVDNADQYEKAFLEEIYK